MTVLRGIAIVAGVPVVIVAALWALIEVAPSRFTPGLRVQFATASSVRAFENAGCVGMLDVAHAAPSVWRGEGRESDALWVERIETCGFDRAGSPVARIGGGFVDLDYALFDGDGYLAACYCRYRAKFVLSEPVAETDHVTVAGRPAVWGRRADPETEN